MFKLRHSVGTAVSVLREQQLALCSVCLVVSWVILTGERLWRAVFAIWFGDFGGDAASGMIT